ncbi:Disease resistance protein rfl1, partial [Thalictrum thalictroides]
MECLGSLFAGIVPNVMICSIKHLNYLRELEENLDQLREKIGELNALRNDVKNSVDAQVGRMMTDQVKKWMQIVDARGLEVNQILTKGRQHLDRRGVFPIVAMDPPPSRVQKLQEDFTVGLESVVEKALNLLAKHDVKVLGLHGVGGVGKTTLLKKINNEFKNRDDDFDIVIWVVISSE